MFLDKDAFAYFIDNLFDNQNTFGNELKHQLKSKKYPSFVTNYFLISGNLELLRNLKSSRLIETIKADIKKEIMKALSNFDEYDLEILKADFQNKYNLSDREFNDIIDELKKSEKINLLGKAIKVYH